MVVFEAVLDRPTGGGWVVESYRSGLAGTYCVHCCERGIKCSIYWMPLLRDVKRVQGWSIGSHLQSYNPSVLDISRCKGWKVELNFPKMLRCGGKILFAPKRGSQKKKTKCWGGRKRKGYQWKCCLPFYIISKESSWKDSYLHFPFNWTEINEILSWKCDPRVL